MIGGTAVVYWTTIAWATVGMILIVIAAAAPSISCAWCPTTATTRTLASHYYLEEFEPSSSSSSMLFLLNGNKNNHLPIKMRRKRINGMNRRCCCPLYSTFNVHVQERRMCHLPTKLIRNRRNSERSTGPSHNNNSNNHKNNNRCRTPSTASPLSLLFGSNNDSVERNDDFEEYDFGVFDGEGDDDDNNNEEARDDDEDDDDDDTKYEWLIASPPLPDPFYPPYSQEECENRKKEMMLIANLNCGDDSGIALFKDHWFSERESSQQHGGNYENEDDADDKNNNKTGPEEALQSVSRAIRKADLDIGRGPDYWDQSQQTLLDILRDDWSNLEARARLSKLFCLMGKFELSKKLSLQVLESKPWHFVAMETMTAISVAENDQVMIDLWKSRRLPNPSKTDERRQWVDRALQDAESILQRMQEQHAVARLIEDKEEQQQDREASEE